jgi:hypothetical protein
MSKAIIELVALLVVKADSSTNRESEKEEERGPPAMVCLFLVLACIAEGHAVTLLQASDLIRTGPAGFANVGYRRTVGEPVMHTNRFKEAIGGGVI